MSIDAVRQAFVCATPLGTRLHEALLDYVNGGEQRLKFTGWHQDGTPFAYVSAPFRGDVIARAQEIAQDLKLAHDGNPRGTRHMPAPAPIKGLADTLRKHLKAATDRADKIANHAKESVTNLHGVLDTAEGVVSEVDAAASDIQAALGLSTNGGPPLE